MYSTRNYRILLAWLYRVDTKGMRPEALTMLYSMEGLCLDAMNEPAQALVILRKAVPIRATDAESAPYSRAEFGERLVLAYTLARTGASAEAETISDGVNAQGGGGPFPAAAMAAVQNALGHRNRALELLERGFEERDSNFVSAEVDARFDSMRSDPRFRRLLAKAAFVSREDRCADLFLRVHGNGAPGNYSQKSAYRR